jgi:hypothetical protein
MPEPGDLITAFFLADDIEATGAVEVAAGLREDATLEEVEQTRRGVLHLLDRPWR